MIVWEIPEDHKIKLKEWEKRVRKWKRSFKKVEKLIGIEVGGLSQDGNLMFAPKKWINDEDLPPSLKRVKKNATNLTVRHSTLEGQSLFVGWKKLAIPDISGMGFCHYMFGSFALSFTWKIDTIGGVDHVILCEGFNLKKYGYKKKEI